MSEQKSRLKRPVEILRAEMLADPDTQRIAKSLDMELEAYVELVLEYAQNPDKEPTLIVAPDEELRAAGYNPPTTKDVANFFIAAANGELGIGPPKSYYTGFEGKQEDGNKPSLRGDEGQEPVKVDEETSQKLRQQVPKGGPDRV
ncbi:hypothetical protein [Corallococcus macrosporus]|uniref:Uncharacterized protein n=2 Tax=Myxococcaceae TaxID=31 RepID=A0A250K0G9_9BACT|nr:hypothetical protein [Corallococcus macrosporus]AEI68305.1 hypothetical protein LILAB_32120 [Corallococcus macrosporus]ATB49091.1 hypothetical protein MYMAC_004729 [Corallococcus macrosporus DSM 14697]